MAITLINEPTVTKTATLTLPKPTIKPRVIVAVLTYNRLRRLKILLNNPHFWHGFDELYMFHQGVNSDEGPQIGAYLRQKQAEASIPFHLRESWQNLMAIGGRQRILDWLIHTGLRETDIIITLDDDVVPFSPHWCEWLVEPFADEKVGAAGVQGFNVVTWAAEYLFKIQTPGSQTDVLNGGMTAYRAKVFLEGVEYDQRYYPFWHCDSDLAMQIREKGYSCRMIEKAGLAHEPHHHKVDELHRSRNKIFTDKWRGKGLVEAERA